MGIRDWFKNIINSEQKSFLTQLLLGGTPSRYNLGDYSSLAQAGYLSNPYVYAGLEMIAKACMSIPITLVDTSKGNEIVYEHKILDLINKPNETLTWNDFIKYVVNYYYLSGNVYIMKSTKEKPRELYLLNPSAVRIILKENIKLGENPVGAYQYTEWGQLYEIKPELVLHIKAFTPWANQQGLYGVSPLQAVAKSIILNNRAKDWNINLIENNARLSGALISKERLPQKAKEDLQRMINEIYSSPENAGRPILLEGGLDWKEMSLNPVELDWNNALTISAREIVLALGVPEEILQGSSRSSYANQRMAIKNFYYNTVIPLMRLILDKLNAFVVASYDKNLKLTFDIDNIPALSEDAIQVWDRIIRARLAGIISKNEARRFLDQPEVENDDFYTPVNVITSDITAQGGINPNAIRIPSKEGGDEE